LLRLEPRLLPDAALLWRERAAVGLAGLDERGRSRPTADARDRSGPPAGRGCVAVGCGPARLDRGGDRGRLRSRGLRALPALRARGAQARLARDLLDLDRLDGAADAHAPGPGDRGGDA